MIADVEKGEHELRIAVDNTFGEHSALHIPNDYYTYGGITRPAAVEYIPDTYIKISVLRRSLHAAAGALKQKYSYVM